MKAVILDGYTTNPGDLSWDELEKLVELRVYDRTSENDVYERIKDYDIVFTNKTKLTKEVIEKAKQLKYIGVLATGFNIVDIEAAKKRNIPVTNVPKYSTMSVAQLVFAHLLEICHHVGSHSDAVKNGQWSNSRDFCFWNHPLIELEGKILGIIGFGSIGQKVAKIAQSFGMNIVTYSRTVKKEFENEHLKFVSLETLYQTSDIISLHTPLTEETKNMINKHSIQQMQDGVIIINTSRGGLIVEEDLVEALESDKVFAAAVDVSVEEPISKSSPLLDAKNIFITPHIAWAPKEARTRLLNTTISNLSAFLNHKAQNVVNDVKL